MFCVIVGDIVGSREFPPEIRKKVARAADNIFSRINNDYSGSLMTDFGIVRGDAFEGVLLAQYQSPKIVQDIIKAFYRAEKTMVRISVVLGQLTVTGSDRNDVDGPAFHTALDELARMKETKSKHWLQVSFIVGALAQPLVDSQLGLLVALTRGWTDKQQETVWATEAYDGYRKDVARKLGVPPSVVSKQLKAAHYDIYRGAWEGLTNYLINIDEYIIEDRRIGEKSYMSYFNIASYKMRNQHNYNDAIPFLEKSLAKAKQDLGEVDPQLIQIYNSLALAYSRYKQFGKSKEAITESLRLQDSLPKTHLRYAETLAAKAEIYHESGVFKQAEKYYKEALKFASDTLNNEARFFIEVYKNLASLYIKFDKYDQAMPICLKALAGIDVNDEANSINYATILENIAMCHYQFGDFKQATTYWKDALKVYESNLPANHEKITGIKLALSEMGQQKG